MVKFTYSQIYSLMHRMVWGLGSRVIYHLKSWDSIALRFAEGLHGSLQTPWNYFLLLIFSFISSNLLRVSMAVSVHSDGQAESVNFILQVGKNAQRGSRFTKIIQLRKESSNTI